MLSTYSGQSPLEIRAGDIVEDSRGTYTATRDIEYDESMQYWTVPGNDGRWHSYPGPKSAPSEPTERVTITMDYVETTEINSQY
jgi:hypothetical protein